MAELHFEDFHSGKTFEHRRERPVSKDEIVAYAERYDPQPFHLDEEAAKHTMLGGLAASGWHTCAILMRMNYDGWIRRTASMGAPGIDEVRWMKPLRPGDNLRMTVTVLDTRVSKSRPDMGLVAMSGELANDRGEVVMTQRHSQMIGLRNPPADASAPEKAPAAAAPVPATPAPANTDSNPFTGYFEDVQIGVAREFGSELFTKESIIAFATEYDPQPFHMDEEAARRSHFGALAASGWHTGSLWMRHAILSRDRQQREAADKGLVTPALGPSPGFTNLKWSRPVYAGDTITYGSRVVEKRVTSRPGWGLMFSENTGTNQNGVRVYEFRGSAFVRLRGKD